MVAFHLFLVALACYLFATGDAERVRRDEPWRITTKEDAPYTKLKVTKPQKNEDYEGYIPDLLKKIGEYLKQTYTISVVADNEYGAKNPSTGRWSGLIGEVIDRKADVAAASITVSPARVEVVDFTESLMEIHAVVVMKKPTDGSEPQIKTANQLADQSVVKYGVVRNGSTMHLIGNSTLPHFIEISRVLNNHPDNLVANADQGIRKVRESGGKFAFITESATGEYWAKQKPCDLVSFELELSKKEYAFAVAKNSNIKARLNEAIVHLKSSGELDKIKKNWWVDQCSEGVPLQWGSLVVPLAIVQLVIRLV